MLSWMGRLALFSRLPVPVFPWPTLPWKDSPVPAREPGSGTPWGPLTPDVPGEEGGPALPDKTLLESRREGAGRGGAESHAKWNRVEPPAPFTTRLSRRSPRKRASFVSRDAPCFPARSTGAQETATLGPRVYLYQSGGEGEGATCRFGVRLRPSPKWGVQLGRGLRRERSRRAEGWQVRLLMKS